MDRPLFGPVDFVVIGIEDPTVPTSIEDAIRELGHSDAVDVVDLVHLSKTADGEVQVIEIEDTSEGTLGGELSLSAAGLTGEEDLALIAEGLEPGSSALVLVIEHTWARRLVNAVVTSPAHLIASEHIPAAVVNDIAALADVTVA